MPSFYLRNNVYVTTSGVHSHAALIGATLAVGIDRVLFAIDYPYESSAEAVGFLQSAPYAPADLERIAHGNAEGSCGCDQGLTASKCLTPIRCRTLIT